MHKKTRQTLNSEGFITMIVVLLAILIAAVVFVFLRVKEAQG